MDMLAQASVQAILKYVCVFGTGFLAAWLLTPLVRRICACAGFMDTPSDRRIHTRPIPRCGLSVFLGFHLGCAVAFLPPWAPFSGQIDAVWWWNFLLLSSLLFAVGLFDDRFDLRPHWKLIGQIVVAVLAFLFDMRVGRVLGFELPWLVDLAATIVWFVAIINAFNLIDGMDGLATGLAAIAAAGIAGSFLFRHVPGDALLMLGLVGTCLGFLRYNFSPATIFLGDSGSMFLGFTLGATALSSGAKGTTVASILVPLLAVGVPLFDMALAVWRRTIRRLLSGGDADGSVPDARVFSADLDHVHHRLLREGLSQRAVAGWLYGLSIALVAVGLLSMLYHSAAVGIYLIAFVGGAYVVVRHLARVELWDSGRILAAGMHRPQGRVIMVLVYPLLDLLILSLALMVAVAGASRHDFVVNLKYYWFDQLPLWVGVPFVALILTRTYLRVWSRARVSEFFLLGLSLGGGILVAAALALVAGQFDASLSLIGLNVGIVPDMTLLMVQHIPRGFSQQVLIYVGLAVTFVAGLRALPRAVQDAMVWVRMREEPRRERGRAVLLYGAGEGSNLFMAHQNGLSIDGQRYVTIVAILDEDRNLHGRYVMGMLVAGGAAAAADIIARKRVDDIVFTELPPAAEFMKIRALAAREGIRLFQWTMSLDPMRELPTP